MNKALLAAPILYAEVLGGENQSKTLVAIHGVLSSGRYFRRLAQELDDEFQTVAFDLLGFGESPKPEKLNYTPEEHVASIYQTFKALKITEPVTLVGHSMGAYFSTYFASEHPELVKELIIDGMPIHESEEEGWETVENVSKVHKMLVDSPTGRMHRVMFKKTELSRRLSKHFAKKNGLDPVISEDVSKHTHRSYAQSIREIVAQPGQAPERFKKIIKAGIPVTVVVGKEDEWVTKKARQMLESLQPDVKLEYVDGGHYTIQQYPEKMAEIIRATSGE